MRKVIKIILSWLSALLLVLILIPIVISLLLNLPVVQNYVGGKLTGYLSRKIETRVTIDNLSLRLFNRITIDGLYVEDYHQDTLLYAQRLEVPITALNPFKGTFGVGKVVLNEPTFYLMQDSSGRTNLKQILLKLSKKEPKKKKGPFRLQVGGLTINNMTFQHRKKDPLNRPYGVDFTDLSIRDFNLKTRDISIIDDSITVSIDSLSFHEQCGLSINNLSTKEFVISGSTMRFKNLAIDTPDSRIRMPYLHLDYDSWASYKHFLEEVPLECELLHSRVGFKTISYFAPGLKEWKVEFTNISGTFSGPVANFKANLEEVETGNTHLKTKVQIQGLPNIKKSRFVVEVASLETQERDIARILRDLTGNTLQDKERDLLRKMGRIHFAGKFDGLFSNFTANGNLRVAQGNLGLKLNFTPLPKQTTGFTGRLYTGRFNIGNLLEVEKLEHIGVTAEVSGSYSNLTKDLKTEALATISTLTYNHYAYDTIRLKGVFENQTFQGAIHSSDKNLAFDFDGLLDINDTIPHYQFKMLLQRADLVQLGFNKRDSVSVLQGNFEANLSGNTLDNINGEAKIQEMMYINHLDTVRTGDIRLVAENSPKRKSLEMYSAFADLELKGKLSYHSMFDYFKNTLLSYIPSVSQDKERKPKAKGAITAAELDSYYLLNMNIKQGNNVAGIFVPGLELAEGTKLTFLFNPISELFSLKLQSEYIERNDFFVSNLNLNSRNQGDSISVFVQAEDLFVGGFYMPNFSVLGGVKENTINLATRFNDPEKKMYAMLSTTSVLSLDEQKQIPQVKIRFNPSTFSSQDDNWRIWGQEIVYDTAHIEVHNFSISNDQQQLSIDGIASRNIEDTIRLDLRNFDLEVLSQLTNRMGYNIQGSLNGSAEMNAALDNGILRASIDFDNVRINQVSVPNTRFRSSWDFQQEQARFRLLNREDESILVSGYYRPKDKQYKADLDFKRIQLSLLDPILKGVIERTEGMAHAELQVSNPKNKMEVNGVIRIDSLSTQVAYTKVPYRMGAATVDIKNSVLSLQPNILYDTLGNSADMSLMFDFHDFKNLSYTVNVKPEKLLVLNTTMQDNEVFYGKVFASGSGSIKGDKNNIVMNVAASTAKNSSFFLPMANSYSISRSSFIVFKSAKDGLLQDSLSMVSRRKQILMNRHKQPQKLSTPMRINLATTITPDAELQILLDPETGDIIRGRGNGSLNIKINPSREEFSINGAYTITEGSMKYTLRNITSRTFTLDPGSTIQWIDDPLDAKINIKAVYKLKASLAPLLNTKNDNRHSASTPVECIIKLTNQLMDPIIMFDVQVPNADPETQSRVAYALNSQEAMATQFIWLLATKSFSAENNSNMNIGAMSATGMGIDFFSGQISSLLSTERFSFAPKYTPRSDMTSDEVGGYFHSELIKGRLILEADVNYNTGNNAHSLTNNRANQVSGDATLSWLFDHTGNIRLQTFTRTIDRFDENQGLQEHGVGIFYRKNFESFKELFPFSRGSGRKKKEENLLLSPPDSLRSNTTVPDTENPEELQEVISAPPVVPSPSPKAPKQADTTTVGLTH